MKSKLFISLSSVLIGLAFFGFMSNGEMKEASRNVTLAPIHEFLDSLNNISSNSL